MFSIIMAGGSGTRFWPASREALPKQFLKITSERTLLEDTAERIRPLMEDRNIYVVVNQLHEATTRKLLSDTPAHVLVEPVGRNTAPCIGLAALHISRFDKDAPIITLPADHFIASEDHYRHMLRAAAEVARSGAIVTLGITPTRPETGYGYIECGDEAGSSLGETVLNVERFVEKPDPETALKYLASGRHLWNSGIFVYTAKTILAEIQSYLPELYARLQEIDDAIGTDNYQETIERVYPQMESISIDYGVMEKTRVPVRTLRGDFGWSDVGSWQALYELRVDKYDTDANLLLADAMTVDAKQNLVYSTSDRRIALLGVEGLVIVDTPDALMVADTKRSQEVKKFPESLKKNGRTDAV